jgi:predicted aspartyl protease
MIKMRGLFLLTLLALCLAAASRVSAQVLKFDYYQGLVFVKMKVNDTSGLLFLMDTGANASAIDNKLADKLKLKTTEKDTVEGSAGKIVTEMVKLDNLEIGKAYVNDLKVTRQDLSGMMTPRGEKLAGILGTDFLQHFTFTLDFVKHDISFLKVKLRASPQLRVLGLEMDNGIPRIKVKLNGSTDTYLRYDSGASLLPTGKVYINVTEDIFDLMKAADTSLKPHDYMVGSGIGGNVRLPVVTIRSLKDAGGNIDAKDIEMIVQPRQGYFARKDAVGFFSNNLLEKFTNVAIDLSSGIMILGAGSL